MNCSLQNEVLAVFIGCILGFIRPLIQSIIRVNRIIGVSCLKSGSHWFTSRQWDTLFPRNICIFWTTMHPFFPLQFVPALLGPGKNIISWHLASYFVRDEFYKCQPQPLENLTYNFPHLTSGRQVHWESPSRQHRLSQTQFIIITARAYHFSKSAHSSLQLVGLSGAFVSILFPDRRQW